MGKLAAGIVLAMNLTFLAVPVASAETRSLKFYFLHTRERAEITYKRNGRYLKSGLEQINRILRDWRRNEPTNMDPQLLDLLWEVYRQSGSREYIHVVSAYRSPQTNAMLRSRSSGVAEKSQHMLGKAVDFYLPDVKLSKLRAIGLKLQAGGVGYYPRSGSPFVHLDVGGVRHWPRMSRKELAALFPDGKTLHIPTDGKPLPGYQQALAAYKARGRGGAIQVADDTSNRGRGRGLLAALFGGGADEAEDNAEATTVVAQRAAPARQRPARQPQPPQAVAQPAAEPREEAESPATILAALPARALPIPRQAPRPDIDVGTPLPVAAAAAPAEEAAPVEASVVAALDIPLPTPRPDYAPPEPAVQMAEAEVAEPGLPQPVAYATPTRRPERSATSDVIAELLAGQKDTADIEPAIAAAAVPETRPEVAPAAPVLAALGASGPSGSGDALAAKIAALEAAPESLESKAHPVSDSPRLAMLASKGTASPAALVSSGMTSAPKGRRVGPRDAEPAPGSVAVPVERAPAELVLSPRSVMNTRPQTVASAPGFSPELTEAPTAVYTDGFRQEVPVADARRFTGHAVTFLSLARFDGE